jgi:hypothetical protein
MSLRDTLYRWWKQKPGQLRKPLVFVLGLVFILIAPFIGWIPGPGGILVFLAGIAILGSEFDWAKSLQAFFLNTVPAEVKKRWRPTPKWEVTFDAVALTMLSGCLITVSQAMWAPSLSLGLGGICLAMFNRERLQRLKTFFKKK